MIREKGVGLFNGNMTGDEEGEYTFTGGKGCTVIDYVMGDREGIEMMRIGEKIDSDHHLVEVWVKEKGERKERNKEEGRRWRRSVE